MKLVYQYMVIFFNVSPPSNHLHPLQVENCDSNSRLVVDEDDNDKFRLERVKQHNLKKWALILQDWQNVFIQTVYILEISIHLKLCVAVARHIIKWVKGYCVMDLNMLSP